MLCWFTQILLRREKYTSFTRITYQKSNGSAKLLFLFIYFYFCRCSCPDVLCRKGALRNFAKFTRKHLCQVLFFNKVVGLRPANFIEKETLAQVFSCGICEISKSTFFTEHLRWLLQFLLERKKSILNSSVRKYMFYQHETSSLKTPLTPKKKQQQYISKWFHFFIQSLLLQAEHNSNSIEHIPSNAKRC